MNDLICTFNSKSRVSVRVTYRYYGDVMGDTTVLTSQMKLSVWLVNKRNVTLSIEEDYLESIVPSFCSLKFL